jgi:exonuclease VII large subunit
VHQIKGLLDRMLGFERGINNLGQYIGQHDNLIQKQLDFFGKHEQEMDNISSKIEQYYDQSAGRLGELMEARMRFLEKDAQNAYENWAAHFERLNQDNVYERIVRYLEPFSQLNRQQETMHQELSQTQKTMLQKMDRDADTQARLLRQLEVLNFHLDKVTRPGVLKKMMTRMFGIDSR